MKLELGAELDIATGQDVRSLTEQIAGLGRILGRRDPRPLYPTMVHTETQNSTVNPLVVSVGGPQSGRVWDIRQLIVTGADDRTGTFTATQAGTAGNAATLTLPVGAAVASITVSSASASAPVTGVVTVTGQTVQSYEYTFSTSEDSVTWPYSPVLNPAPSSSIVVNMPAVVGGSAYTLEATYVVPVAWYLAQGGQAGTALTNLLVPGTQSLPCAVQPASSKSIFVHEGELLVAVVYGLTVGQQATAIARVADWADSYPEGQYV